MMRQHHMLTYQHQVMLQYQHMLLYHHMLRYHHMSFENHMTIFYRVDTIFEKSIYPPTDPSQILTIINKQHEHCSIGTLYDLRGCQ